MLGNGNKVSQFDFAVFLNVFAFLQLVLVSSHVVFGSLQVVLTSPQVVLASLEVVLAFLQIVAPSLEVALTLPHVVGAPFEVVLSSMPDDLRALPVVALCGRRVL